MTWNPLEKPFRLIVTQTSAAAYHHGWMTRPARVFATEAEAISEAQKPQGRGVLKVRVDRAVNPETWIKNGRWEKVFERPGRKVSS